MRVLTREEVVTIQPKSYRSENWTFGLNDFACVQSFDPTAYMCCVVNNEITATASVVKWDASYAFAGSILVRADQRGKGYGSKLMRKMMENVGDRNVGTDAIHAQFPVYEQSGFVKAYEHFAIFGVAKQTEHPLHKALCDVSAVPFAELAAYDALHFPVPRPRFLEAWIKQPNSVGKAYVADGKVLGYGVLRPGCPLAQIGPVYAASEEIACGIVTSLANNLQVGEKYEVCTYTPNPRVMSMIKGLGFEKSYSYTRMYNKRSYTLPDSCIYACVATDIG